MRRLLINRHSIQISRDRAKRHIGSILPRHTNSTVKHTHNRIQPLSRLNRIDVVVIGHEVLSGVALP